MKWIRALQERPGLLGGFCAAVATIAAGSLFFPLIEVVDQGGDDEIGMVTSLVLGMIGGVYASPVAFGVGYFFGRRFGFRTVSVSQTAALVVLGAGLAGLPWFLLGGFEDPLSMWPMLVLGAIATTVAVILFNLSMSALANQALGFSTQIES